MPERDELDLLIDEALRTYGEAGSGLEERVLYGVTKRLRRMKKHLLTLAIALPLAACVLLVLMLPRVLHLAPRTTTAMTSPLHTETHRPDSHQSAPGRQKTMRTGQRHVHRALHAMREQAKVARPKLDVFPSPVPLTHEEEALVRYVAQTPARERITIAKAKLTIDEPLHVAAIQISPIQPPNAGNE